MAIKKIKLPDNTTEDINDSRLPVVTTTDNGKILSVSGGIWSANDKPSYTLDEVPDGSTRALSNFLPRNGGYTMTANAAISWGNNDRTDWNTYVSGIRPMSSTSSSSGAPTQYCSGINIKSRYGVQLAHAATSSRFWGRVENQSWVEFYHSGNSNKSDVNWACNNLTAAGTVTQGSDSRIKDNQQEISPNNAIAVIERLVPKTWTWNEKTGNAGKKAAGLVAQEVEEVIPDSVTISNNGDIKDFHSLNYNTIQGYEIAAIKGLIEEVKSLKAEIAELKKQIK